MASIGLWLASRGKVFCSITIAIVLYSKESVSLFEGYLCAFFDHPFHLFPKIRPLDLISESSKLIGREVAIATNSI